MFASTRLKGVKPRCGSIAQARPAAAKAGVFDSVEEGQYLESLRFTGAIQRNEKRKGETDREAVGGVYLIERGW